MGLFDKLAGLANPTAQWPVVRGDAPAVQPTLMQFDAPQLGDSVDTARFLGKPDTFTSRSRMEKSFDLVHAGKGLRLRYTAEHLAEITLYIGPQSCDDSAFIPVEPVAPDGSLLTPDTSRQRILEIFGEPEPLGSDDIVLQFFHGRTASDLFFDEQGRLESWVLYPND